MCGSTHSVDTGLHFLKLYERVHIIGPRVNPKNSLLFYPKAQRRNGLARPVPVEGRSRYLPRPQVNSSSKNRCRSKLRFGDSSAAHSHRGGHNSRSDSRAGDRHADKQGSHTAWPAPVGSSHNDKAGNT